MTRPELLAELRSVLNVATTNVTWADSTLYGYLAEGQDVFCEDTGYFIDSTTYGIALRDGIAAYDLPDRIIQVMEVWNGTWKLDKWDTGDLYTDSSTSNSPSMWRTDKDTGRIVFWPIPNSAAVGTTLRLQVWRYAIDDLSVSDPELPEHLQRACIEYAAYKAFNHHDIEAQDPVKAVDHLNSFRDYVRRGKRAMRRFHNIETRVGTDAAYVA